MNDADRPRLLLVISTERHASKAIDFALAEAEREQSPLVALYVLDSALPESLGRRLSDDAFVPDRLADDLTDAVKAEQYKEGMGLLQDVRRRAAERKVECEIQILPGPMNSAVPQAVRRRPVRHVVLSRRRRGRWEKWFRASEIEELAAQLPCEVTILDD